MNEFELLVELMRNSRGRGYTTAILYAAHQLTNAKVVALNHQHAVWLRDRTRSLNVNVEIVTLNELEKLRFMNDPVFLDNATLNHLLEQAVFKLGRQDSLDHEKFRLYGGHIKKLEDELDVFRRVLRSLTNYRTMGNFESLAQHLAELVDEALRKTNLTEPLITGKPNLRMVALRKQPKLDQPRSWSGIVRKLKEKFYGQNAPKADLQHEDRR